MPHPNTCEDWHYLDRRVVKSRRISLGYDRAGDLADLLGVSPSTYYHWEIGTHRIPPDRLRALAKALRCKDEELVE